MFEKQKQFPFPGVRAAMDGNSAAIHCERESSDAAGAYPITPSTQMGEYWAEASANGHINVSERPLVFIEPEGEHAAAAVTAGLAMTGLRSANFSSGQGVAYMHESLYAAVGKRLTYVLNIGARAITKATLNVHAGHDDYHCVDDTGFFQLFAKNAQQVADLNICAHRIAELALNPGIVAQDGFLTTHLIESMLAPERELIKRFLGRPEDIIKTPTPAQRLLYGDTRRRIPLLWDVDNPVLAGAVQNQDSYMQSVAAQRPFFFEPIRELMDQSFEEFYQLTGRRYSRVMSYKADDADYLILAQGSIIPSAEVVADYLREHRGIKVGVLNLVCFRPFAADLLSQLIKGKKAVAVLERLDQPLACDLPMMRELRATVSKCMENGFAVQQSQSLPYPELACYRDSGDVPLLYSGCFGLGSRDLQAEGIIGAVENMLPEGEHKKQFYLGIDFLHDYALTPTQEVYQQKLEEAYPHIAELAVHGSENPNLMPADSITIRFHSVGGWGAITTGKNLAMTLFELLGYHIKANPKYGSEKKGQPTTYYMSAAPQPIRMNCEYYYVDVVISPDPNVFHHTNALAGLKDDGVFIIQSELGSPEKVWANIPANYQKIILEKNINVFYVDAFAIARSEATDPELQLRMQGNAFQGAFFAVSGIMQQKKLNEATLLKAIEQQLQHKFGAKGARVVADNLRVVKRGFDEVKAVNAKAPTNSNALAVALTTEPPLPYRLKTLPQSQSASADIHRFWEQTGNFYNRGKGADNLADPFMGLSLMPAISSVFRDMSGIRFKHPQWIAENCTACGDCYTVCPDTAIPGLANELSQVLDALVRQARQLAKAKDQEISLLPRAVRIMEPKLRALLQQAKETSSVTELMLVAMEQTEADKYYAELDEEQQKQLEQELDWLEKALGSFQFAITRPYFTVPEKKQKGSGGLFSLTINPYTCKGCEECIQVCEDDALKAVPQTDNSLEELRHNWAFWQLLPSTPKHYIRVSDLEQRIGALQTILLNKDVYTRFASGDGACMGCAEKTVLHLFIATVESLMQPRAQKHVQYLRELIIRLERHMESQMVAALNVDDVQGLQAAISNIGPEETTLANIAQAVENNRDSEPVDRQWLERCVELLAALKQLLWQYTDGISGQGRTHMGIINATGCSSVWGSTYPFNPYPFPWANHLFQDSPSMAMGVFEGHMIKMAEGFKTIRRAELELAHSYNPQEHDDFFRTFTWQQFSDEEFALCPPVVSVGGDGAMYDIGFQNLSRMMMSGKPIKVVVLDTQVYSNTGGQACTSGFMGQVSDMAPFGQAKPGKLEIRKEMSLIAMAHRTTYVMQSTIAYPNHMIEGFVEGLQCKRPALFNCYTSCQPEHGIGDDMSHHQAKLAVESRAYPLFHYNPDKGKTPEACFDLHANPALHDDWPQYKLHYRNESGKELSMELPMTFADFAMTESRFRKHFRSAPPDTWHDNMIPLAQYLELPANQRNGKYPFIWSVNKHQQLGRLLVSDTMVSSCEDRRNFWVMLKAIARIEGKKPAAGEVENKIRQELLAKLNAGFMQLLSGELPEGGLPPTGSVPSSTPGTTAAAEPGDYMAPWIDSEECTACDECTELNSNIFEYNEKKQAIIKDPQGGPYRDLVKAAERCTAQVIHPGLPMDRSDADIEQWIKRGEVYN